MATAITRTPAPALTPAERISQLRQRSPAAVDLARLVAPAARIEPELLRAMRLSLLAGHGPSIEADLWFSPLVRSRHAGGIVLDGGVAEVLRDELRLGSSDLAQRRELGTAQSVMAAMHAGLSPALLLEERVAWASIAGNLEDLNDELARAVKAIVEGKRPGLQAWAAQAVRRLPAESFGTEAGQALRRLAQAATVPTGATRGAPEVLSDLPVAHLGVRRLGGRLALGSLNPPAQWAVTLPDTEPRPVEVVWQREGAEQRQRLAIATGDSVQIEIGEGAAHLLNARGQRFDIPAYGQWMGPPARWATLEISLTKDQLDFRLVPAGEPRRATEGSTDSDARPPLYSVRLRPDQLLPRQWPPGMVDLATAMTDCRLLLGEDAAGFRWEAFVVSSDQPNQALGLRGRCVRMSASMRMRSARADDDTGSDDVFVIGRGTAGADAADQVARALSRQGYEVAHPDAFASPEQVMSELFRRRYRLLHLSGERRATREGGPPGLDIGPGLALTAGELESFERMPEFVVADISDSEARDAEKWARHLLGAGVHAALIASTGIAPAAARAFLHAFYAGLLGGATASEAAWLARSETHRLFPDNADWSAFELWGDAEYRLAPPGKTRRPAEAQAAASKQQPVDVQTWDPALRAVHELDRKSVAVPGLYSLRMNEQPVLNGPLTPEAIGGEPLLVLVHPMCSNTVNGFRGLWEPNNRRAWDGLTSRYRGRIYTFEHWGLSLGPVRNALALAQALPQGARLHLLTLSDGGLVGELLARGLRQGAEAFDAADFALVDDADRDTLAQLGRELMAKRLQIERFVRVACPARGTPFAERAHQTFGKLSKALTLIGSVVGRGAYELLGTISQPERIPGLRAVAVDSPLLKLISRVDVTLTGELSVVAGRFVPGSLRARLAAPILKMFLDSDNDLLVPTDAMFAGPRRSDGMLYVLFEGAEVTHFTYFERSDIVATICDRLLGIDPPGRWVGDSRQVGQADMSTGTPPPTPARSAEAGRSASDLPSDGAVLISFASDDRPAAERLARGLRAANVDVWFDQRSLQAGEEWEGNVLRAIDQCAVFIPLISPRALERAEGFFWRDWRLATDRASRLSYETAFLLPVVVDGTELDDRRLPEAFRRVQNVVLPEGAVTPEFTERVRQLQRAYRSRTNAEAQAKELRTSSSLSNRIDDDNPWPGLAPFEEPENRFFHGRDAEARALLKLVREEPLTVLVARSGLGKTSLLKASLFPRLRSEFFLPVYLRMDYADFAAPLRDQVLRQLATTCAEAGVAADTAASQESLWHYFHRRDVGFWDRDNRAMTPVIVIDQFEEVFTLGRRSSDNRSRTDAFLTELADLAENHPPPEIKQALDRDSGGARQYDFLRVNVKLLLVVREEFLIEFEGIKSLMPSVMSNRLRMLPMTGEQAYAAVMRAGAAVLDDEVARCILRLAWQNQAEPPLESVELAKVEIDPGLLNRICFELNHKRQQAKLPRITRDLMSGTEREMRPWFYQRALAGLDPRVLEFIEKELITQGGQRASYDRALARDLPDVVSAALVQMTDRGLLRVYQRQDRELLELADDLLAQLVRDSRDKRRASM